MTGTEVIAAVKKLGLPDGSYVVFGSAPLAVFGLRDANDIDILVTQEVYDDFATQPGWEKINKGPLDQPIENGIYELQPHWNFSTYKPTLHELLSRASEVDGVMVASLEDVRRWKSHHDHPNKGIVLKLIDEYLLKNR